MIFKSPLSLFTSKPCLSILFFLLSGWFLILRNPFHLLLPISIERSRSSLEVPTNKIESKSTNTTFYYRHATEQRNSSYPFISGDTFRAFSTYVFDETKWDKMSDLKFGDVVFLKGDLMKKFFDHHFRSITQEFILVTHNSDVGAPGKYENYLNEPKILHWFASNPTLKNHSKLSPIPIGLANSRWIHGKLQMLHQAYENYRKPWRNRETLLYANFDVSTNRKEREKALSYAKTAVGDNLRIVQTRIPNEEYLKQVGNTKFVLSPAGNGLDCHRTWEALLMGAVPVLVSSPLDSLFENQPAVILKDWSSLNSSLLLSLDFRNYDNHLADVLKAEFWAERINKYRLKS